METARVKSMEEHSGFVQWKENLLQCKSVTPGMKPFTFAGYKYRVCITDDQRKILQPLGAVETAELL